MTPAVAGSGTRRQIAGRNKARLYRYDGAPRSRTPVLFVPNLGISRPWIFECLPGGSFIESLVHEGFDVYVLDWGVFGPEDRDLTFEACLTGTLAPMWRTVLETSRAPTHHGIPRRFGTTRPDPAPRHRRDLNRPPPHRILSVVFAHASWGPAVVGGPLV